MQKIAIFGGSFNPIHNGHIRLIECFDKEIDFDKILCIPTNVPPHKDNASLASGTERLAMLQKAFAGRGKFYVSGIELERPGKSYTYDTICLLEKEYQADFYLILGSDMFLSFTRWYRWQELLQKVKLCAMAREDAVYEKMRRQKQVLEQAGGQVLLFRFPYIELSSTQVREAVAREKDISEMVPPAVAEYIEKKHLYR